MREPQSPDYRSINATALRHLPYLVQDWLPHGRLEGNEWVALNPLRLDHCPGSFKVNVRSGRWADFATGERGGDVISLAAFLGNVSQRKAALYLADILGIRLA